MKHGVARDAFEAMRALVLGDEEPRHLPLHKRGRTRFRALCGGCLHARGDSRRVAEDFAGRIDADRAALKADPCGERR